MKIEGGSKWKLEFWSTIKDIPLEKLLKGSPLTTIFILLTLILILLTFLEVIF